MAKCSENAGNGKIGLTPPLKSTWSFLIVGSLQDGKYFRDDDDNDDDDDDSDDDDDDEDDGDDGGGDEGESYLNWVPTSLPPQQTHRRIHKQPRVKTTIIQLLTKIRDRYLLLYLYFQDTKPV